MKKRSLGCLLMVLVLFGASMLSYAEDNQIEGINENSVEVVSELEKVKSDISSQIKNYQKNDRISEEEMNGFLSEVEKATTIEEIEAVLVKAQAISYNQNLSIAKNDISNTIKDYQKNDRISEEEMNGFLFEIEKATTIEEVEAVLVRAQAISYNQNLSIAKNDISNTIKDYQKDDRISEEEMNEFLSEIEKATTIEEVEAVLVKAQTISNNKNLSIIKSTRENQIKDLQKENKISKDQMNGYLSRLEVATTAEEVDRIWFEAKEASEKNTETSTNSNTEASTEKNKGLLNNNNQKKSSDKSSLPQTNEKNSSLKLVGFVFLAIASVVFLKVKKDIYLKQ